MTIVVSTVIFAAALIFISKIPVALAMAKVGGRYNNRYPREQQAKLTGFGARALGAHKNCIEAFPLFAAGVCLALIAKAPIATVENLCLMFVAARVIYILCYLKDIHWLRSSVWFVGIGSSFWLMALALFQ